MKNIAYELDIDSVQAYARRAAAAASVADFLLDECVRMDDHVLSEQKLYKYVKDGGLRLWMPYCFTNIENSERELWLPINRNYSLLGRSEWTHYNAHAESTIEFSCDIRKIPYVWWKEPHEENEPKAWLYSDDPASWRHYATRLRTLLEYRAKKPMEKSK